MGGLLLTSDGGVGQAVEREGSVTNRRPPRAAEESLQVLRRSARGTKPALVPQPSPAGDSAPRAKRGKAGQAHGCAGHDGRGCGVVVTAGAIV